LQVLREKYGAIFVIKLVTLRRSVKNMQGSGKSVQVKKKTKMGTFNVTIAPDDEGT